MHSLFWSCGQSAIFAYSGGWVLCAGESCALSIHLSPRPPVPRLQQLPTGQGRARACRACFALLLCHCSMVTKSVESLTTLLIGHLHYICINHMFTHFLGGSPRPQFRLGREPCMPYTLGSPPITHGCYSLAFTHISSSSPSPITAFAAAALSMSSFPAPSACADPYPPPLSPPAAAVPAASVAAFAPTPPAASSCCFPSCSPRTSFALILLSCYSLKLLPLLLQPIITTTISSRSRSSSSNNNNTSSSSSSSSSSTPTINPSFIPTLHCNWLCLTAAAGFWYYQYSTIQ